MSKQVKGEKEENVTRVTKTEKKARPHHYWVRPRIIDGDLIGLSNHNLSKWRDTVEIYTCKYDEMAKKWLTGLDENDPKILAIENEEERVKKQNELRELREQLEKLTGKDLSATNDEFWSEYLITFTDNMRPFIPHLNPWDRVAIEVLKRRGDIAFGGSDLHNARYTDSKYYIESEEQEISSKKSIRKLQKQAISAAFSLEDNYDKLWKIAYLLNLTKTVNENSQSLIDKIDNYVRRNEKYSDELEKLVDLVALTDYELEALTMFRKAIKAGVIKFDAATKLYHRGGVNFKGTEMDSVKDMTNPEKSAIYAEIIAEVSRKEGNQANYA